MANHLAANCTACHGVETPGSEVGPDLRTIGQQRDAAYILRALVAPSAEIATGRRSPEPGNIRLRRGFGWSRLLPAH